MSKASDGKIDITARIDIELRERSIKVAETEGRSLSNVVAQALKLYVEMRERA